MLILTVFLLTAQLTLGKIGGPCTYNGLAGTCKSTSDCGSGKRHTTFGPQSSELTTMMLQVLLSKDTVQTIQQM